MTPYFHRKTLATSLAVAIASFGSLANATDANFNVDMGTAASSQAASITLTLKLHNQPALEQYVRDTVTPGSAHFQQFLSTSQFASQFGATPAEIAQVKAFLTKNGLTSEVLDNHMNIRVTGTLAQLGAAFGTTLHTYVAKASGLQFHRPASTLVMPAAIASLIEATSGMSSEHPYLSHRVKPVAVAGAPEKPSLKPQLALMTTTSTDAAGGDPTATGVPGSYTVGDVANFYNINPLYKAGVTGKGSTVAIVTLSNFYPADAQTYWTGIGLTTKPNRIKQVHVDGGSVIDGGSGETALDVEQSGGLAPDANIIVYDAPNAGSGFVDAFAKAVSDNKADSISTSWGSPEIFNFKALNVYGSSNTDTSDDGDLRAFHQIFMEAAAQGQSVFAASGDSGAYDTVRSLGVGTAVLTYTAPLTVDSPASDPYITAAGGTTRPFTYSFNKGPKASLAQESVWGWDYIQKYFDTNFGPGVVDLFSTGGGGGVSVYWKKPFYQSFTAGIRRSEPNQALTFNDEIYGPTTLLKLPANFSGRNVPDISLNADPETGYTVVSTYDGGVIQEGGTSFVAPQLNGISALLRQSTHHRIGLWNPQVYAMQNIAGYGKYTPFRDIRQGDNWFYYGKQGYEQGAGIGVLNVTNLDLYLKTGFFNARR